MRIQTQKINEKIIFSAFTLLQLRSVSAVFYYKFSDEHIYGDPRRKKKVAADRKSGENGRNLNVFNKYLNRIIFSKLTNTSSCTIPKFMIWIKGLISKID